MPPLLMPLSPSRFNGNNIAPGIYEEAVKRHFWTFWSAYNFVGKIKPPDAAQIQIS